MAKKIQRRRQIVVNKKYQNEIVFAISWPPALCLVLTAVALGLFCWNLSVEAIEAEADLPSLVPVFLSTIGFLLLASIFQFFNALKFSHRLAGPTVNIARVLKSVQGGDLTARISLRRNDLVRDVADEINALLDWLENHPPVGIADQTDQTEQSTEQEAVSAGSD